MAILLTVLKLIGLILLIILAIIVIVLLLILFWPVKYQIKADYQNKIISAFGKASWMHIATAVLEYNDDLSFKIKILFWKLMSSEKDSKGNETTEPAKETKNKEANKNLEKSQSESNLIASSESENSIEASEFCSELSDVSESEVTSNINKMSSSETVSELQSSEEVKESTINSASDTGDTEKNDSEDKHTKPKIYVKIKQVINVFRSDLFKNTYPEIKRKVIKVLKIILPRKWNVDAIVGFEDPSKTGNILIYTSLIYPFFKKHINVVGDFENPRIEVHIKAKGRITLFRLLIALISIYFDKKIKRLLTKFKEAYNG